MYVSNTLGLALSQASPTAGTICSILAVPDAGVYSARIIITLTGTAETQLTNLKLRSNGVTVISTLPTIPGTTIVEVDRIQVVAGANVDVVANSNATAGASYTVLLMLTRIA